MAKMKGKPLFPQLGSRSEANPYISRETLIKTSRAVKRQGHDLILQFAGDSTDLNHCNGGHRKRRIRYMTNRAAKAGQQYLMRELLVTKNDVDYNRVLVAFLMQVVIEASKRSKLPSRYVHVHEDCPVCSNESARCLACSGSGEIPHPNTDIDDLIPCFDCHGSGEPECNFNWQAHSVDESSPACPCNPILAELTESNEQFIVHRSDYQPAANTEDPN